METSSTFKKIWRERQEALNSLRESEEKCRIILDEMHDAYFEVDLSGNFTFFNKALCHALGYSHEEMDGMNYRSVVLAEDTTKLYKAFNAVFTENLHYTTISYRAIRKDGSLGEVEVLASPIKSKLGEVVGFRCMGRDITERRRMETLLRESENLYRSLVDTSPHAIGLIDLNGTIIMHNKQALKVFGFEPTEDLSGRNLMDMVSTEHYQTVAAHVAKLKNTEVIKNLELISHKKDGRPFWLELSSSILFNEEGTPKSIMIVFEDITIRKQNDEELRKSEELYRTVLQTAMDGFWTIDLQGRLREVNEAYCRMSGYSAQELVAMRVADLEADEAADDTATHIQKVIAQGEDRFETHHRRKDGSTFAVEISVQHRTYKEGSQIVAFLRDITERKIIEEKLLKSYESLKKTLNDAINTMVKIVEMRDPYTAGHQQKVADLTVAIAKELKLDDTRIDQLRMAAVIHDIGKMYVPSDILSKPGTLSKIELDLIETHSKSGYDIVKGMDFPCSIANTILQHHERLDGSGYPQKLKGDDTLLDAKILAVADVIEAMASHRPYRAALGIDKALEELSKNRGKLYDADVVDACLELFSSGKFEFKSV